MAKPEQPKDIKPKAEGATNKSGPANDNMKVIIINIVTTVLVCVLFLSVSYVLQANLLTSKLATIAQNTENNSEEDTSADQEENQKGFILDLGDFILNLSDSSPRRYLKVNVALEVSNTPEELAEQAQPVKEAGGHGGEGEKAPAASPLDTQMAQFKPSIRDAVISTLSSKTSAELATTAGKELAKEQITEAVNGLFAGEREVIRVSFGEFIIQ